MSLIIATGSNLGDKEQYLRIAKNEISKEFKFIAESRVFVSEAIEYLNQPDFYNQMLEFELPKLSPLETLHKLLAIEKDLGRTRDIDKGPRTVDIDIIFWGTIKVNLEELTIPHPAWNQRSFVIEPLRELPYFKTIEKHFIIPNTLNNSAKPI